MDYLKQMSEKISALIKKVKELRDQVVKKNTPYVRPEPPTCNYEIEARDKPEGDPQIIVFGALNVEYTTYINAVPKPGEYVLGMYREKCYGGKAANQCIAANRLGAHCALIGKMGDDELGRQYHKYLRKMRINTEFLKAVAGDSTGISHIYVDDNSRKTIVVVYGANCKLTSKDVKGSKKLFRKAKVLLCQLETDQKAVLAAIKQFKGVSVLNAAPIPMKPISAELYAAPTIICVNAVEAAHLTKRDHINNVYEAKAAANDILAKGAQSVIITLGEKGAIHVSKKNQDRCIHCPAAPVRYVADTSGAGDAFLGSLAYHMAKYPNLAREYHIHAANICAAHSVGQRGTQPSFPGPELASFDLCRKKPVYYVVPDKDPNPDKESNKTEPKTGTAENQQKPLLSRHGTSGALQPKITFMESTIETSLAISGQNSIITTQNAFIATADLPSQKSIPAVSVDSQNTVATAADTITGQKSVAGESITSQKSATISSQNSVPAEAITSQKSAIISSQNSVPAEAITSQKSAIISSQKSVPADAISSQKSLPTESISSQKSVPAITSQKSTTISSQKSVPAEEISSQKSVPAVAKSSQKSVAAESGTSQKSATISSQKSIPAEAKSSQKSVAAESGTSQKSATISSQKSVPAEAIKSQKSLPADLRTSRKSVRSVSRISQKYIKDMAISSQKSMTETAKTIKNGLLSKAITSKKSILLKESSLVASQDPAEAAAAEASPESAKATALSSQKSEEARSTSDESAKAIKDPTAASTAKSIPDLNAAANRKSEDATEILSLKSEGIPLNPKISIVRSISDGQSLKGFVTESKKMCSNVRSGIKRMTTRVPATAVAPVSVRESSRASPQRESSPDRQPRTAVSLQSKRKRVKKIKRQSTT